MLQAAAAEGRLTLEDFSERSWRACASLTRDELAALVADLPVAPMYWTLPMPAPARNSPLPQLALFFGVVAIPMLSCMPLGVAAGIAGIVLGVIGLRQIRRGTPGSRVMARAGVICGSIAVVLHASLLVALSLRPDW